MAKDIYIESTYKTPEILFKTEEGFLSIKGKSIIEDVEFFYKPILSSIYEYINNPNEKSFVVIDLEYFNTPTSKVLMDMFIKLKKLKNLNVKWYCDSEDDDMYFTIKDFRTIVEIDIEIIKK